MNLCYIIYYVVWTLLVHGVNCQMAQCRNKFISGTNPGVYYEIYPLALNGVPYNTRKAKLSTYLSTLSFYGTPIYSGNAPGLDFNAPVSVGEDEIAYGTIYGNEITVTNFSMAVGAWVLVPETGWYTFNIQADSAAELFIVNSTGVYCCENPYDNSFNQQFMLTSIPSEPDVEQPSGQVFLYSNFYYELLYSYINLNSSASFSVEITDPSGNVYSDITPFVMQMNARNDSEIVTCNYVIQDFFKTVPWTGTAITTLATEWTYTTDSTGGVILQELQVIGTPNEDSTSHIWSSSQTTSKSIIESQSGSLLANATNEFTDFISTSSTTDITSDISSTSDVTSSLSSTSDVTETSFPTSGVTSTGSSSSDVTSSISSSSDVTDAISSINTKELASSSGSNMESSSIVKESSISSVNTFANEGSDTSLNGNFVSRSQSTGYQSSSILTATKTSTSEVILSSGENGVTVNGSSSGTDQIVSKTEINVNALSTSSKTLNSYSTVLESSISSKGFLGTSTELFVTTVISSDVAPWIVSEPSSYGKSMVTSNESKIGNPVTIIMSITDSGKLTCPGMIDIGGFPKICATSIRETEASIQVVSVDSSPTEDLIAGTDRSIKTSISSGAAAEKSTKLQTVSDSSNMSLQSSSKTQDISNIPNIAPPFNGGYIVCLVSFFLPLLLIF
ncbi:hypothetical protein, no similarity [Maudiozyma saulgeensis]|uniref:PA14 domain-containing protein n=1 Tax=Maudiozyma saulgeensis TaxID=1789683 RepID=A0A1X7QW59_9SACH|nr:hypothetical protein, no similarity [Kazachstania saulgeensis]